MAVWVADSGKTFRVFDSKTAAEAWLASLTNAEKKVGRVWNMMGRDG